MYRVGLTGGIGSGKSTVARRLAELGCAVVDADQVARDIVEPGEPALTELEKRFGPAILTPDGRLDRAALASIVFVDDDARRDLERITHPHIAAGIRERLAREGAQTAGDRLVVVDHPLLVETGQQDQFDAVVVVLAPEDVRVERLRERGMDEADARARIRAQTDDITRRAAATHVLVNDGSPADLTAAVDRLHAELLHVARQADVARPDPAARGGGSQTGDERSSERPG